MPEQVPSAPQMPTTGPPQQAQPGAEGSGDPAQEVEQLLVQAILIIQNAGPQALPGILPVVKGFYAQLDQMVAPIKAAGQQAQQGQMQPQGPQGSPMPPAPMPGQM
jgi:hypothetical protein